MMACAFGQAEQARLGVAGLRARRDGADFDEAEAERGQRVDVVAVLVQPGGQADRVGEGQSHHGAGRCFDARREQAQQAQPVGIPDGTHAEAVGGFSVEAEKHGADE